MEDPSVAGCRLRSPDSARAWLPLALRTRSRRRTWQTLRATLANTPDQLIAALPDARGDADLQRRCDLAWSWLTAAHSEFDRALITWDSPQYPPLLRQLDDPPVALFAHGQLSSLSKPAVAMVGARRATRTARHCASDWAEQLAAQGIAVVSGLAQGLDAAAHQGSLNHLDTTVAVAATGLDRVYPRQHQALAQRILERGVVLSEHGPDSALQAWHFPQRNRIISGLCVATVVVEADVRSGSMTTAQHAAEQGREVLAVPGSILNPLARGCHRLIRDGAALVDSTDDLMACVHAALSRHEFDAAEDRPIPAAPSNSLQSTPDGGASETTVLDMMGFDAIDLDTLTQQLELPVGVVSATLVSLEMQGYVQTLPGGRYVRCKR